MSEFTKKKIIQGGTWLFLSEITDKLLAPIIIFLFARIFGSEVLGQYSFIMSFVSLTFILSDLGTTLHAIRKCTKDPQNLQTYF
ncbi:MAG: oligosaccharide flippase family protein, partial [Nanoarchaeota archaeon]